MKAIKNIINKIEKIFVKATLRTKTFFVAALSVVAHALNTVTVYATGGNTINIDAISDPAKLFGEIMVQLCNIAQYVGLGLVVFGLFQLFLSFKDSDSEGKSRAILLIAVGIFLGALKTSLVAIGLLN